MIFLRLDAFRRLMFYISISSIIVCIICGFIDRNYFGVFGWFTALLFSIAIKFSDQTTRLQEMRAEMWKRHVEEDLMPHIKELKKRLYENESKDGEEWKNG